MVRIDGSKLRHWRERRLLTLRELGERSGVQFHTIHAIEVGKHEPRISTLRKILEALDVSVNDVLPDGSREESAGFEGGKAAA